MVGIAAIVWGTKITLDNAVHVARHYGISDFFIGVGILAVGSDMPEIVLSVTAAVRQLSGLDTANLIVGNALGSCLGQFGLVMGVAGMMGQLSLPRVHVLLHGGVLLASMLLLTVVGWNGVVSRMEGMMLVTAFLLYLAFLVGDEGLVDKARDAPDGHMGRVWTRLALGMLVVVASAELIVHNALELARLWQVDQSLIGIVIIGMGTSLPELMISVGAILRARMGLSVGNLLGSNILDILVPIGLAAIIVPIGFKPALLSYDLPILFGLTILVLVFLLLSWGIRRPQAVIILACYVAYVTSKLVTA